MIGDRHDAVCQLRRIRGYSTVCTCAPVSAIERDEARIRAELRDRLDRCDDHDHGTAFGWLADNHPDLVREALDETGAPS